LKKGWGEKINSDKSKIVEGILSSIGSKMIELALRRRRVQLILSSFKKKA
jgi:hypothetical protein